MREFFGHQTKRHRSRILSRVRTVSHTVKGVSDEVLESTFINGLRPNIRVEIRLLGPNGSGPIMEIAQRIEDKNLVVRSIQEPTAKIVKHNLLPVQSELRRFENFPH